MEGRIASYRNARSGVVARILPASRLPGLLPVESRRCPLARLDALAALSLTLVVFGQAPGAWGGSGIIITVAGTGVLGVDGDGGPATSAQLGNPSSVAFDAAGNLFIAEPSHNRIRQVAAGTGIITTVAGSGVAGFSGDGGLATSAQLDLPYGVAVDAAGNLFIAAQGNPRIRQVASGTRRTPTAARFACTALSRAGGPATSAQLGNPSSVAIDAAGNLFIAE